MAAVINALPRTGRLEVDIKVTADVNVTAFAARQKVNDFILSDISYMMVAGEAQLVLIDRICWRVPVFLSLTSQGLVGEAGAIDVDVETGQLFVTPQLIAEIQSRAENLAQRAASSPAE
jgi:hypothetical protein